MNNETIVAVFDTAAHAAAAVRDLETAGVPSSAITQHADAAGGASLTGTQPPREQGFWGSLFGGEPDSAHDTAVYDRSLQGGSTVVSVTGAGEHQSRVLDILERHNPIDIDERAASYGATTTTTTTAAATGLAGKTVGKTEPGTLSLSEETLAVGKRAVNLGTTRVRRYVVETPVEEQVNLRDERVTIERRPVTDGRAVSGSDFSDKVIEVTETAEEAVVSKQARVREEVVIRKDATERTETVRDTLRREDVEIVKDAGTTGTHTGAGLTGAGAGLTGAGAASTGTSGSAATGAPITSAPYKPAS